METGKGWTSSGSIPDSAKSVVSREVGDEEDLVRLPQQFRVDQLRLPGRRIGPGLAEHRGFRPVERREKRGFAPPLAPAIELAGLFTR